MKKVVGFDIDGVLASFIPEFTELLIDTTKMNFFGDWKNDPNFPPCWHFAQDAGYSNDQVDYAWELIHANSEFWCNLEPLDGVEELNDSRIITDVGLETYFITQRAGVHVKEQTEQWLYKHIEVPFPTVLISGHKGSLCAALDIDCYIDDRLENIESVMFLSPSTRAYLLDAPYNRENRSSAIRVVGSVGEFLEKEGLN